MDDRGKGISKTLEERTASHFGVSPEEVTPLMLEHVKGIPRGTGLETGRARGSLTEERIEEIARNAAREVVEEEVSKAEVPLHILEHEATGHALVVDAARAEATPCKCFTYDTDRYGFSPGCIGLISEKRNPDQFARFCKVCIPVSDGLSKRFARVKEEVGKAHEEWRKEGGDLAKWWKKVGPALES